MNFFITSSPHDNRDKENGENFAHNENKMPSEFTLNFLKSYWKKENENEIREIVKNTQKELTIENLFSELDSYAAKYFNTTPRLSIVFRENTIDISQAHDTVYMNNMMANVFWSYLATQLYHSYVLDTYGPDSEEDIFCYQYSLFILNDMCFNKFNQPVNFPNEESNTILLDKLADIKNILDVASDLFYCGLSFALLHEISHAYLKHSEKSIEIEKEADEKAYLIFLDFCFDIQHNTIDSKFKECFVNYTYLAPMYLLEFYYIVYYTGSFLCPYFPAVKKEKFDDIVERKEALFEVFYAWERDVDPTEAYDIYNAYLDGTESFVRSFIASDKAGMLNEIKERNKKRHHD